ncbi:Crp/Fnr family transcriptional regulator [Streptomyces acidiscabies]|uniref:Cyclic nucleotide-binding domain-containing protein n=1 Tax=Streptomyces acidiscabies TaxID=42234 RepID=A0AAP6BC00_9ACTN|nr:cyclic nucleotide-binding domain-containing protein [Streptomyces acidiscabies]MBP5942666.1 cyclic nucleotide-binding domain-containing protein [Streptomyces sp. LBUM 1476]MBZ3917868.1 cyclic nucleotide-binding domain-containing protein [Streptomyces acidiscabies]MDX2961838.1 cyclic nucleotide-binding domain-containing protein [Streptomyces acidiscabies]MDX3023415.1 cyclic nucleotide-binding domain-containing protein [Streptomyces acidiscabies]MDX3789379.1 cyclic nucleotide-binding domain-c
MTVASRLRMAKALGEAHRERLLKAARETDLRLGTRLFDEGEYADRFWVLREGTVALDVHVPGRRAAVVETLGAGDLTGCSWLFEPYVWQLGATATTPVRAYAFDAVAVRRMCDEDADFGRAVGQWVGQVLAGRLAAARTRLVDLYGTTTGAGGTP